MTEPNAPDPTVTQEARQQIMRIIGSVCYSERSIPQATDDVIATILSRPEAQAGEVGELIKELRHIRRDGSWHEKDPGDNVHPVCARAADLLERLAPRDGGEDEVERVIRGIEPILYPDHILTRERYEAVARAALATLNRGKAQVRDRVLSSDDIFDMGYAWALSLRGQTMEDSRAVGRTLGSQLFEPIRDEIDRAEKEEGFNPFTDADTGIVVAKRIIKQAIRSRREGK